MVFLTGHSGAGKEHPVEIADWRTGPDKRSVVVDGSDISRLSQRALPWYRRQLGIVLQDHNLLDDRSVLKTSHCLGVTHLGTKEIGTASKRVRWLP